MHPTPTAQRGFTLIELSIVLTIIGLIVGGIMTGRSLIHAAELQSIVTDQQRYVTAANAFRVKYEALPGDMTNATNFWGTDPGGCPNAAAYTTSKTATCNGNGNGFIQNDGEGQTGTAQMFENFRAWQQLANAGLISGAYSGTPGPAIWTDNEPGLNVPTSKIANAGFEWAVFNTGSIYVEYSTAALSSQYLLFGSSSPSALAGALCSSGSDLCRGVLTPAEAQAIDLKIDDGLPLSGVVLGSNSWDANGQCLQSFPSYIYNTYTSNSVTVSTGLYCALLFQVKSW